MASALVAMAEPVAAVVDLLVVPAMVAVEEFVVASVVASSVAHLFVLYSAIEQQQQQIF